MVEENVEHMGEENVGQDDNYNEEDYYEDYSISEERDLEKEPVEGDHEHGDNHEQEMQEQDFEDNTSLKVDYEEFIDQCEFDLEQRLENKKLSYQDKISICEHDIKECVEWKKVFREKYYLIPEYRHVEFTLSRLIERFQEKIGGFRVLVTTIEKEEKDKTIVSSKSMQYDYNNSLWSKLFNQYSFHNELYGQILFHVVIGTIADIEVSKGNETVNARVHLFLLQDSRSGKNRGMNFVETILQKMYKKKIVNSVIQNGENIVCNKVDNQSDGTMLNRPVMVSKKGVLEIKKDYETGEPIILDGLVTRTHLMWYEEADFLLNTINKYAQEARQMFLTFLEGRPYYKELVQWSGYRSETLGDFCMVCLTRPIDNIKLHIIYSGMLMRMLFIPRILSSDERQKMIETTSLKGYRTPEEREEYQNDFKELIANLESLQTFSVENHIIINPELINEFRVELFNKQKHLFEFVEKSRLKMEHKKILVNFIAGFDIYFYVLSYQSALIRKSKFVELGDLEYAYNLIKRTFEQQVLWIEDTILVGEEYENKWERRRVSLLNLKEGELRIMKNNEVLILSLSKVKKYLCEHLAVSLPTAKSIILHFSRGEGKNRILDLIDDKVVFH